MDQTLVNFLHHDFHVMPDQELFSRAINVQLVWRALHQMEKALVTNAASINSHQQMPQAVVNAAKVNLQLLALLHVQAAKIQSLTRRVSPILDLAMDQ